MRISETIITGSEIRTTSGTPGPSAQISSLLSYPIITGLTTANNGSGGIDIYPGSAVDASTRRSMSITSPILKLISAPWTAGTNSGGLDTGIVQNNTWYYMFLIGHSGTGSVDGLFSTSATSPTMPTNYDTKRRIGAVRTGVGSISGFVQHDNNFEWKAPVTDQPGVTISTGFSNLSINAPPAFPCMVTMNAGSYTTAANNTAIRVFSTDSTNTDGASLPSDAAKHNMGNVGHSITGTSEGSGMDQLRIMVISGTVRAVARATCTLTLVTTNWDDRRGQDGGV